MNLLMTFAPNKLRAPEKPSGWQCWESYFEQRRSSASLEAPLNYSNASTPTHLIFCIQTHSEIKNTFKEGLSKFYYYHCVSHTIIK